MHSFSREEHFQIIKHLRKLYSISHFKQNFFRRVVKGALLFYKGTFSEKQSYQKSLFIFSESEQNIRILSTKVSARLSKMHSSCTKNHFEKKKYFYKYKILIFRLRGKKLSTWLSNLHSTLTQKHFEKKILEKFHTFSRLPAKTIRILIKNLSAELSKLHSLCD